MWLTDSHKQRQKEFREFVDNEVLPFAVQHDLEERVSEDLIKKMAQQGYLGATVTEQFGGLDMDMLTFSLLNEEFGRGCSSARSLLTVQSMVTRVLERWGSEDQKSQWLPRLASGASIASFALTEPEYGSDAANIQTSLVKVDQSFVLQGSKKWISFGQIADIFLTFCQNEGKLAAVIVEKDTPGLSIQPINGLLGVRGAMLAELHFDGCLIPASNLVGKIGFGLYPIALAALDIGRYSIACGCVGMAQACLESSVQYAGTRKQFNVLLKEHQLIQEIITNMMADIRAARLLCHHAGQIMESGDRRTFKEMLIAKYFAAKMASRVTSDAVQVHGANGFSRAYPVERFFRDAKIMEVIEGSNQILQIMIAKYGDKEIPG